MAALISHASSDENGKAKGGKAGDQTGKEVCIRSWYNKPWNCVIRFTDASMREKIAQCMENAAKNNHIGYDQNQRNTLLAKARKYNYDVSKVTEDCETDCSALVSVACMYAGIPESILTLHGNCATTRTLKAILKASGEVDIFTTPLYVSKPDRLIRGDILLKEGAHVAVVVEGNDLAKIGTISDVSTKGNTNPYEEPKRLLKRGEKGEDVKWVQWELVKRGLNIGKIDGIYGQKVYSAVCIFQKNCDGRIAVDGIVGKQTIAEFKKG